MVCLLERMVISVFIEKHKLRKSLFSQPLESIKSEH